MLCQLRDTFQLNLQLFVKLSRLMVCSALPQQLKFYVRSKKKHTYSPQKRSWCLQKNVLNFLVLHCYLKKPCDSLSTKNISLSWACLRFTLNVSTSPLRVWHASSRMLSQTAWTTHLHAQRTVTLDIYCSSQDAPEHLANFHRETKSTARFMTTAVEGNNQSRPI